MPPLYTLRTLGVPSLHTADGEAVRFRTRKHFALLIRLAVEPGRPLTRDHLIELLWGSAPEAAGRHSLAQAVTILKAKIGRAHLLIHKSTITLAAGIVATDVAQLENCDGAIGGRFLEAFEIPGARAFEDWRDAWHARLLPRLRDCLVRHMDAARRIGDFATVQQHAEVLAELDPLSEDALRGIMEARAWVGDRTNALKAYAAFATRLEEELGAKPAPELARIAHLLREGRRSPYRQPSDPPPAAGEKRFEPERVVGREREFSRLYDAWIGARRREPCIMVLTGDPGVGKTTLTNAFASTCQMEGAVVARAQAYDAERELPFAVLAELVRQLTIQRAIGAADPEALGELSRICPDVVAAFPGVPKPVEWSAEITPLRLADAFLKTILSAAEESPLVLVVDDVHAADNASAAILHVVARKLPAVRLVLVLTGRPNELRASGAAQALTSDTSITALRSLDLEPLTHEAAQRLVAVVAQEHATPLPEAVTERILAASGGNPLAIELLAREWQAHGAASLLGDLDRLNTLPAATLGIPRAIRTVFDRQASRLDRRTRSALDLAAVLGRRLSDLALYEAVDLRPAEAAEALSRLKDEGLLREVHSELEFRNELLRAQAYYAVAAVARQHLHRSVARMLSRRDEQPEPTVATEIGWHYLRAGDALSAVPHALGGSLRALAKGAAQEVESLLQNLARAPLPADKRRLVDITLCRALVDQSKAGPALPILDRLLGEKGDLSLDQLAEVSRLRATAEYLTNRETGQVHAAAAEVALVVARETKDKQLLLNALFEYARSGAEIGDEARVQTTWSQLHDLMPSLGNELRAFANYVLGYCEHFLFNLPTAVECLTRSIELLESSGNENLLHMAYTGLSNCYHVLCRVADGFTASKRAFDLATRMGNDSRASVAASNLSALMLLSGDFREAIIWGKESVLRGERAMNQPLLGTAYGNLTEAYLLNGNVEDALRTREAATKWMQGERSWYARLVYAVEDGCHLLLLGNLPAALEVADAVQHLAIGRERSVPPVSSYDLLKSVRLKETLGIGEALSFATEVTGRYWDKMPLALVSALTVESWLGRAAERAPPTAHLAAQAQLLEAVPGRKVLYRAIGILD